ncbi:hypothetical protein [Aquimarina sp. AU474]|uniref:hypothetical protein n=1 Tax=Aquimarina sp. AU474 TaxID=2108529 RepID=UPI000D699F39|nr:hypothetical protein [Aquimarina sp. AU474]
MKKKWYFGILLTAFALLVVMQQQTVVPNQEIVLEFVDVEVTSLEAQKTIAIVKKQLQSIGVKNTKISRELKNGKLKIAYYSDADVAFIKRILSKEHHLALDHVVYDQNQKDDSQFPFDKNPKDYNFDVYEIQKSTDVDFNGVYVLNVEQKQKRNFNSNSYSLVSVFNVHEIDNLIKTTQKIYANIAIAIDNTSYKIPEVRAGPIS